MSGLFDGCLSVMVGLVTHDIVGRKMMAKAVGTMYGIVAIPMTVGPPMAGTHLFNMLLSYLQSHSFPQKSRNTQLIAVLGVL